MKKQFDPKEWINKQSNAQEKFIFEKKELSKTETQVIDIIEQIENANADVTFSYKDWVKFGFALVNEFSEGGRDYFHRLSRFHSTYDKNECDIQFDKCLQSDGNGITIGTFFFICNQHGFGTNKNKHINNESYKEDFSKPHQLHVKSLEEMILKSKSEPPIPYLWSGIKLGSFGFIFGPSKSGKTTFCENLALSIASGQKTFFNMPLSVGIKKVLFLSLEEYWQPRTERNSRQMQELKVHLNDYFLTSDENFPRILSSKEDWILLKLHISQTASEVVFVDSLSRLYSGSIEDSDLAKELLLQLRELTNELKITLIIIHHTPKQVGRPLTIDSMAGSRILAQEADFMIGISKTIDGTRYMKEVAFRYAPENDEYVITFEINSNSWLTPLIEVPEYTLLKSPDGRNDNTNCDLILEFFENHAESEISARELLKEFVDDKMMSKPTFYKSLNKLIADKKIIKVNKGKYKFNA